jgi:archaellum component FlaC
MATTEFQDPQLQNVKQIAEVMRVIQVDFASSDAMATVKVLALFAEAVSRLASEITKLESEIEILKRKSSTVSG